MGSVVLIWIKDYVSTMVHIALKTASAASGINYSSNTFFLEKYLPINNLLIGLLRNPIALNLFFNYLPSQICVYVHKQ